MKLRLNDMVAVTAGKDKGKTGKITKMIREKNRVIVAGVNKYKRHMKKKDAQNPGGVVEVERSINASNVMLLVGDKTSRIGYSVTKTGDKVRIAKKTGEPIDKGTK
jgi:large subunit ribosomal protein L24